MTDAAWIVMTGVLAASACALVGPFLVLRRLAMLGDAISHAILPGLVLAFLVTGSRNVMPMLVGAAALGILTAVSTDTLNRYARLQSDAAIGVTFTFLFAVGIILISRYADQVDLDADCVWNGEILFAPFYSYTVAGITMPRSVWILGGITLANLLFVLLGYKQLKLCAFDPALAAAVGIRVAVWHYLLMGFVSLTTVAAFESVGAILVIALLIVPPNTAYLLTDRLSTMIVLSVVTGALSAGLGYEVAALLDGSIAGAIATVSGGLFALAALFSPRHGVIARAWGGRRAARRGQP